MNRLQHVDVPLENRYATNLEDNAPGNWSQRRTRTHLRTFIPLHYEANYAYPLIVWLHGATGDESEINRVMPHISMRNYVGVSPRGVVKHERCHPNGASTFDWNQDPASIEFAVDNVLHCVESTKSRFNIAPDRIFLAGNDTGGTMALRIAFSMPDLFAGVASIGGTIPMSSAPMAGFLNARSLPVMLMHGRDSVEYSSEELCSDIRLLHSAGMKVNVRQYPCEHEVTTKMLSDLNVWMMNLVTGQQSDAYTFDEQTSLHSPDFN